MTVTEQTRPATGARRGPAPYGYEWHGSQLVPVPREQAIRWLILHLNAEGWSLRRISAELDHLKIPTRAGLRAWPTTTLRRVLAGPGADVTGSG